MTAEQNNEDLFCEVCKSFSSLSSNSAVSKTVFDMLQVRIETMAAQYNELIRLNYDCIRYSTLRQEVEFDPETSLMTIKINGQIAQQLKLNRANPNVPIEFVGSARYSVFVPAPLADIDQHSGSEIERDMGRKLESYYYYASKTWDVVEKEICGKSKPKFIGVKMVRNRLLEHSIRGEINSFGATTNVGPTVKPMRQEPRDNSANDAGLIPNTRQFLKLVLSRLETE